ncbi:hypothetical protein [Dyadobacter arcticus]|uniref:Polyketide cyclase / dehydrase and lipid transport n=1 Tax=Dyadobacter arcticus TaxID=1078754 RepID=A0ABX0UGZ1_9BACT|nr:hypothetical protein [Dyadobacter arcticus]NIJ52241.1 hypothetical protein [Dyadobacter arcticus]
MFCNQFFTRTCPVSLVAVLLSAVALVPGVSAQSKAPAKYSRPVAVTRVIDASAKQVWALLATPGHLANLHAFAKGNTTTGWSGKGSMDMLDYYGGISVERKILAWLPGKGYDLVEYELTNRAEIAQVSFRVKALGKTQSELTITERAKYPDGSTATQQAEAYKTEILPGAQQYFGSLENGINYY